MGAVVQFPVARSINAAELDPRAAEFADLKRLVKMAGHVATAMEDQSRQNLTMMQDLAQRHGWMTADVTRLLPYALVLLVFLRDEGFIK